MVVFLDILVVSIHVFLNQRHESERLEQDQHQFARLQTHKVHFLLMQQYDEFEEMVVCQ
jgi:hypothetical protein